MKQRVLLANKFYYRRGGDCVVTMSTEQLLRSRGHEVGIFAMRYGKNDKSDYSHLFASEVDFSGDIRSKLRAVGRTLGYGDIRRQWERCLDELQPDVVHLHNIHSYLSPELARIAHRRGIRVVWTLHDYKLVCPTYSCLDSNGAICRRCIGSSPWPVLHTRCMKGSLAASGAAWLEAMKWDRRTLERIVDCFICPSEFMAEIMASGGFSKEKLRVINNFCSMPATPVVEASQREPMLVYAGRLSREKGVATLLEAVSTTPWHLYVAGDGPLGAELRQRYGKNGNIHFMGHVSGAVVGRLMSTARASVIPSEWYENNPMGVIESLWQGTPVVGAAIGGIPELIGATDGSTFASGSVDELKAAIENVMTTDVQNGDIARRARERFCPDAHYQALMQAYSK